MPAEKSNHFQLGTSPALSQRKLLLCSIFVKEVVGDRDSESIFLMCGLNPHKQYSTFISHYKLQ